MHLYSIPTVYKNYLRDTVKMKVHIVFAHMESKSFNAAILDVATKTLEDQGHTVTVADLYKMKFNPVISREDRTGEELKM